MPDGSVKWLPKEWRSLMALTVEAVDSVDSEGNLAWSFGGGASLAVDLGHRISHDVDVFLDSAAAMKELVPVANGVTRAICWDFRLGRPMYDWPGNYLKLIVSGKGEIDFLNTAPILDDPTVGFLFEDREIRRDRAAEVIAKKICYRGSQLKARDAFDLAGAFLFLPAEVAVAARSPFVTPEAIERTRMRIALRRNEFQTEWRMDVNPTEIGLSYAERFCDLALDGLSLMDGVLKEGDIPDRLRPTGP